MTLLSAIPPKFKVFTSNSGTHDRIPTPFPDFADNKVSGVRAAIWCPHSRLVSAAICCPPQQSGVRPAIAQPPGVPPPRWCPTSSSTSIPNLALNPCFKENFMLLLKSGYLS